MSNFTPLVQYSTEFDGDKLTMNLARLKRKDMLKLTPYVMDAETGEGKINMTELIDVASGFIHEYVSAFEGLTDARGNVLKFQDVVDEVYFMGLLSDIITKVFEISNITEADVKNSAEQPSMSALAQATSEAMSTPDTPAKLG